MRAIWFWPLPIPFKIAHYILDRLITYCWIGRCQTSAHCVGHCPAVHDTCTRGAEDVVRCSPLPKVQRRWRKWSVLRGRGANCGFFRNGGTFNAIKGPSRRHLMTVNTLPRAEWRVSDRGYDADSFREALIGKDTTPCIPGRKSRKKIVRYPSRDIALKCTTWRRTSAATNDATVLRECSAASRTGGVSQHATTEAQRSSCQQSLSPRQLYSRYDA
jgi:hypothetical protein